MTTQTKHTPLNELVQLAQHIADTPYALTPDQWASEARQALKLSANAVNSHYQLVEALKDELEALETWLRPDAIYDDVFDGIAISRSKIKAALALAEKGME